MGDAEPQDGSELEALRSWRFEQLLRLGVTARDAQLICASPNAHHLVGRLLALGCPPDTAVRIIR